MYVNMDYSAKSQVTMLALYNRLHTLSRRRWQ